jgi:ABC-type branched-subunit amino acid transport system substrate-binding protein
MKAAFGPGTTVSNYRVDSLLGRGGMDVAKEKDERYPSCGAFIKAAAEALGVEPPGSSAIAGSDGTRESVLKNLRASRVKNGILGDFRFDRNGDLTPAAVPIVHITGSTPPSARLPEELQGGVIDRVVQIPRTLIR